MTDLLYKQVPASTTVETDLGEFTAIAAAYSVDRQGERIIPGAFSDTIQRWRGSGKMIPLAWDHSRAATDIIGSIDPNTMHEVDQGLYVEGRLDIEDSELAREAWRSVKANRVGLSFGYLVEREGTGDDGVKELHSLDVFEITITSTPANADARVLSAKSQSDPLGIFAATTGEERLRAEARRLGVAEMARKAAPIQVARFEVE